MVVSLIITQRKSSKVYETYQGLCRDYGTELVDNFGLYFDLDGLMSLKICTKGSMDTQLTLQNIGVMK